ncbi:hypothetical protein HGO38_01925 [Rhizobium sp. CG5]|uniref:hypothetical protein n=1 Tax=Rhizobium sp. CG5 TaxID=2726076 RepID=UPI00203438F4|nr:hypothetical protein [Rhizobium sp. CG5]MCM2472232.1 hypothetical protein [Rhizobium sp. CG5]
MGHRKAVREISLAACVALSALLLGGCATTSKESAAIGDADLPIVPVDPAENQTKAKGAQGAKTGYVDPMVASAYEPTPEWSGNTDAAAAPDASPQNDMAALIVQPTGIHAGNSSIFSTNPPQYGADPAAELEGQPPVAEAAVASLVPQDMPVRGGINPAFASVFSLPPGAAIQEEPADKPVHRRPVEPEPPALSAAVDAKAEQPTAATEPVPAEPVLAPGVKKKKGSVLRRLHRRNAASETAASR